MWIADKLEEVANQLYDAMRITTTDERPEPYEAGRELGVQDGASAGSAAWEAGEIEAPGRAEIEGQFWNEHGAKEWGTSEALPDVEITTNPWLAAAQVMFYPSQIDPEHGIDARNGYFDGYEGGFRETVSDEFDSALEDKLDPFTSVVEPNEEPAEAYYPIDDTRAAIDYEVPEYEPIADVYNSDDAWSDPSNDSWSEPSWDSGWSDTGSGGYGDDYGGGSGADDVGSGTGGTY